MAPLIKIVIEETRKLCKKEPTSCGYNPSDNAYEPLKLMQTVMARTNDICLRYLDNSTLCSLPAPGPPYNTTSVCAVKNNRRRMEDRHIVIHDLNSLFIEQEVSPSSYYAIFDGHAGHDAAAYSCAHLHQFLAESKDFVFNPGQALRDAFLKTDALFLDKCKVENFSSGTTAVCALLRHKEKTLYIAWVGDSQALLVRQGRLVQCVAPHKPSREDEKNRIEKEGGVVIYWGTWRVNGQLAVSRAIGDYEYKPYVTAVPDVLEIPLTGAEDFLILACDGLWDFLSEDDAARCVYDMISKNSDDIDSISQGLVQLAKQQGSCDNISVIVVFLRETSKVAAEAHWATRNGLIMDTLDNANATNPFANSNNPDILAQTEGFVLNLADGFKQNGTEKSPTGDFLGRPTNGKRPADDFDEDDDDLGPETDVDAVDDVLLSPAIAAAKSLAEGFINNNAGNLFDPFGDKEEKAALETDSELQKRQTSVFDPVKSAREETPTPPADSVHEAIGLVDNVADSGEDSDDEWNYIKGDIEQKENIPPSQTDKEVCELTNVDLDSDNMSQLNPNAVEFVPVSPKRNTASPAYLALVDDSVIAQSPRRVATNDIDITVPNPQDFECEIKSRPSDVVECANGDEADNQKLSSQEIMENLLNGKSLDEIEFQPNSTPTKTRKADEFHFGPNATPFSTPAKLLDQSEALSTQAVFGDDSTASYLEEKGLDGSFAASDAFGESQPFGKEQDPMSMSFYQDKDDDTNPFDLNKVQVLPENVDDFLQKPSGNNSSFNETISDLPEHNPIENIDDGIALLDDADDKEAELMKIVDVGEAVDELLADTLQASKSPLPTAQSPMVASPSPIPAPQSPLFMSKSPLPATQSPLPGSQSPVPAMQSPPVRGTPSPRPEAQSPMAVTQSPLPGSQSPFHGSQSPLPGSLSHLAETVAQSPLFGSPSPQPFSPTSKSPLPTSPSPIPPSQSPLPCSQSPLPAAKSPLQSPVPPSPFVACQMPLLSQSPVPLSQSPLAELESPLEDVTSSVKDSPLLAASPVDNKFVDELKDGALNFAQEISNAVVETIPVEAVSPTKADDMLIPESCPVSTPKSSISEKVDTESVVTADMDSFFDRSMVPSMASPLSTCGEVANDDGSRLLDAFTSQLETNKIDDVLFQRGDFVLPGDLPREQIVSSDPFSCSFPMQPPPIAQTIANVDLDIKSEVIAPEFAVQAFTTPSDESKGDDVLQNETVAVEDTKESVVKVAAAAATAVVAATAVGAAAAATTQKKPLAVKAKSGAPAAAKKAPPKPATSPTKPPPITKAGAAKAATARASLSATTQKVSQVTKSSTAAAPKPLAAAKPTPKPRVPLTATAKAMLPSEKKPLTNGEVKPAPIRKVPLAAAAKTTATKPVPSKLSPTKTTATAGARPATAPAKTASVRQTMTTTTRPTTLATKTSTTRSPNLSSVTATKSTTKPTSLTSPRTTTAAPKPRAATAPSRPKPLATKTLPKAADTEKQIKETANKQITASSRISAASKTTGTAGRATTTTVRKTEAKLPGTRTTVTKTTTTTVKATTDAKKPAELVRHVTSKTKAGVTTKKTKTEQNGIVTEINTVTISATNIEPQLVKDVSPVIENLVFDNSQLPETNVTD